MDLLPSSALCFLGPGSASGISFTGLSQSRGLFGDLIGDSAGTWLSAMSVKIGCHLRIGNYLRHGRVLKRTVCQALGAIPVSEPNNWILRQLRVAFSQELKRRASLFTRAQKES